jgi:hypothetical protein
MYLRELSWLGELAGSAQNRHCTIAPASARRLAHAARKTDEIDILNWLGGVRSVNAKEEAVGLGSYGKTLAIPCPY